jgi:hypothetical protein
LLAANALFTVPWLLVSVMTARENPYFSAFAGRSVGSPVITDAGAPFAGLGNMFALFFLVFLVCWPLASATTVVIVSDNYLGREVTIATALSRAVSRFWAVLIAGVLSSILTFLGFVLFIIPGFFCMAWFYATANIVMVEGKNPVDALSRGQFLAKGSVGRILGTLILAAILVWIVNLVISAVLLTLIRFLHVSPAVTSGVGNLASILVYPFITVVSTVLYFDQRVRREGLDLELMAKELGAAA